MEAMKKVCALGMLAAAAIAFAGCSKEVEIQDKSAGTHTLTFTVQKDIDTKTAVQEGDGVASYVWTEGDEAYIHVFENGKESTKKTVTFSSDYKIATVQATFADYDTTAFSYSAVYGSSLANKTHNPLIPSAQSPRLNSFDPAADVLVSNEPIEFEGKAKAAEDAEFKFVMKRVVSANKMTLRGLVPGEKVTKVELASDKYFASRYMIEKKDYTGDAKKLVLDFSGINAVVGTDGSFPVYFTSAPVDEASFSVTVTTDQHVYTRDDFTSKLTFAVGTFRRFGINLYGYGEEISTGVKYTLVDSNDDLYDGATYLLVGASSQSSTLYALGEQGKNNRAGVAVTDNSGVITIDNTINAYPIIIETVAGGYTLKDASTNYYLYNSDTGNNRLHSRENVEDNNAVWTINISNGVASVNNVGNTTKGVLCFNPTWQNNTDSNPLFAAYGSVPTNGTAALALYVDLKTCVELEEAGLAYSVTSPIEVAWDNKESFVKPTLANPNNLTVTYSSSDETVATVDASTGDVTFVGNGTTTITASSARTSTYKAGVATYQITVTDAPAEKGSKDNPYTPSEARDAAIALEGDASENDVYVKGIVSEVTTAYSSSFKNVTFNLSDDGLTTSDQFVAFREKSSYSSTVAAGDAVIVKGKIVYYKSTTPEFQADNAIQTLLAKPVISGDENFTGTTSVTISAADGSAVYYTTDGSNPDKNSSVYSAPISISATTTVKAIAVKDGLETGIASKTFTKVASYAVTFGTPSNGTIVVKHGETTLISGDEIAAGETITITATPSSGYVLSTLVYNDGSDHDIKSDKSFTMPAHSVSIAATFEESHGGTYSMTPDQSSTGSNSTSYITTLTEFTYKGISWKMNQWNPSSLQIRTNQSSAASEFRFYNTSAFSGRIKKVVITFSALTVSDASKLMFLGGTSEVTATTGGTAGTWDATAKTLTWTPSASDDFTYFAFYQNGKAASGTNNLAASDAIVVEYE